MGKHTEWRKLAKKLRRKRIRQQKAQQRHQTETEEFNRLQCSLEYQSLLAEKIKADKLKELEEEKLQQERERQWLKAEEEAQKQFKELQIKLALAKEERANQNEKIKRAWEEEQKIQEELRKHKEDELQEKIRQEEKLKNKVEEFLEHGGETPEHLKTVSESNPTKALCPFFRKTSTCRFYDVCSRNHVRPGISKILLIPNFFSHYSLENINESNLEDSGLEFTSDEVNKCYRDFYKDVVPELENYGNIRLFITCSNHGSHLRGNVFVEYYETNIALKCYRALNGRWYGGKQLSVQFVNISNWNSAICGVNFAKRCPKGSSCNFLHTFRNPGNSYSAYEKTKRDTQTRQRNQSESRNWRWSETPERSYKEEEWEIDHPSRHTGRDSVQNGNAEKESSRRSKSARKRDRSLSPKNDRSSSSSQDKNTLAKSQRRSKSKERNRRLKSTERNRTSKSRKRARSTSPKSCLLQSSSRHKSKSKKEDRRSYSDKFKKS